MADHSSPTKDFPQVEDSTVALLHAIPDPALLIDADGTIRAVNAAAIAGSGKPAEELIGTNAYSSYDFSAITAGLERRIGEVIRSKKPLRTEEVHEGRRADHSLYPVVDKQGKVTQIVAITRDITEYRSLKEERERLIKQVKVQERTFNGILSASDDRVYVFGKDMRYTYVNPPGARALGMAPKDIVGKTWKELGIPLEPMRRVIALADTVFATGRSQTGELPWSRADDTAQCYEYVHAPIFDSRGEVTSIVTTFRNITERKRAEENAERLAKFPKENPNPVMRLNAEGELLYANKPGQRLLENWNSSAGGAAPQPLRDAAINALSDRQNKTIEVSIRSHVFEFFVAPIIDSGYVNFYGRDIMERKWAEKELQRAHEEVQALNEELQSTNEELRFMNETLEERVQERTLKLQNEIEERKVVEEELRTTSGELQDNIEELRRAEQSVQEHARTVDILNRVIRAGNEADELQTMLSSMLDTALELMGFDGGTIYSLNEAQHGIELQYQRGYSPEFVKRQLQHVSLTQKNVARIYKGEPLFSEDYVTDAVEGFNPGDIMARAAIPLIARDSVIGHYTLFSRHLHRFTPEERELLVTLGREAATVIAKMQAEEEVKEQVRIIDLANDAIIIRDVDHHALSWNRGAERVFGWTKDEAIGQHVSTLLQTKFPVSFDDAQKVLMRDGHWEGEMRCTTKNGARIVLYGSWTLKRDDAGNPTAILSIGSEVTERKQAETKIARLNRLYTMLSGVNEAMWRIREPKKLFEETCRIVVEDGLFRMAWIGRAELNTLLVKPIAHWGFDEGYLDAVTISAEDVPEGRGPTGTALREGRYVICNDYEHDPRLQIWRSQALKRGYHSSAAFPLKIGKRVMGVLSLYADEQLFFDDEEIQLIERLTADLAFAIEFIEHEEEFRAASLYSRSLIEASLDPLVTISAEGKITDVNKATEDVTGCSREELIGSNFNSYFTNPAEANTGYRKVLTDGFVRDYPLAIHHKSGKITDVLYNATMYRNESGEIQGVFAAARDITERKQAEEALRRAHNELERIVQERTRDLQEEVEEHKVTEEELRSTTEELQRANEELQDLTEELQRSNKELEQFAYIASHDLQEPLRTVTSAMGLLEQGYKDKLGEEADTFIAYAVDGTKQMRQLIKDLLAYSRVTSRGQVFKSVNCSEIVQHATDNLKASIEESGAKITLPGKPMPIVMGDSTQLIQLFQNLIGNAIKFRSERLPEVQIDAELDAGGNTWQFSIRDNGIGMDMQYADKIFIIFQRLHTTEQYDGTGVGLALCKKIVERHNGKIWVDSKLGKGTTFYFTLPFYVE